MSRECPTSPADALFTRFWYLSTNALIINYLEPFQETRWMQNAAPLVPHFDQAAAIKLVMELMAIPGRSKREGRISGLIVDKLLAAGVPRANITTDSSIKRIPGGGEVGNLIVNLPETIRAPRRLLMAHLDTVPICVGCQPRLDGDFIRSANPATGLGGDDRGGVAVVLTAALELLRSKRPCQWALKQYQ